ncbi:MAG: hypothetical protein ACQEP6_02550 [Patescibacteria group bacterium]
MSKYASIIIVVCSLLIVIVSLNASFLNKGESSERAEVTERFIECLKKEGVTIYGGVTCPACAELEKEYGGQDLLKPIYLDCSGYGTDEETEKCEVEKKTDFLPEVKIKGELFRSWGSPENLAKETGCKL